MPKSSSHSRRGAALIIVLAFVVLLTGLSVAYFSRSINHRQIAHGSFNQSNADQLASSAMAIIIGDLRQEIAVGSASPAPTFGAGATLSTLYTPTANANMAPTRSGKPPPAGGVDPIPNLIRRSVRNDGIAAPGLPSRAVAVNSVADPSANGRSLTKARWNQHYLIPKQNLLDNTSEPTASFDGYAPDWVMVTAEKGARVLSNPTTDADGGDTVTPVGRYAYAIYDEGGLLDMNVAGYPSGTSTLQSGRKGSVAFADLTALSPPIPNNNLDKFIGWRNYATTQATNTFPGSTFAANLQDPNGTAVANFYKSILQNVNGFLGPNLSTPLWNGRTDQALVSRRELIDFAKTSGGFTVNALQYLGTFSRAINAPSFSPSTPTGSSINYATLASTSDAVNPNFLRRRAASEFIRFDGTRAVVGEPLVKTRFPLSRIAWITYKGPSALRTFPPQVPALASTHPDYDIWSLLYNYNILPSVLQAGTAANIKTCFGLTFPVGGSAESPWTYTNPNGAAAATRILRLDEVVAAGREADFFELLQAGILSGSLGQNTGGGVTGGNVFPDIHMSNATHHLLSIGAAMIDQADPDSIPTRIVFNPAGTAWAASGVESLPYITQLYPIAGTSPDDATKWATYLLFQLWNPHQNAAASTPSVRLRLDGGIGMFTGGNGEAWNTSSTAFINATGQWITVNPTRFTNPAPLSTGNVTATVTSPGTPGTFSQLGAPVVP